MKTMRKDCSGFSLIEVAIALAVATFCLVTLMALIPEGLNNNQIALNKTTAASVLATVVSDLRSANSTSITVSGAPVTVYQSPLFKFQIPTTGGTSSANAPQQAFVDGSGAVESYYGTTPSATQLANSRFCISIGFTPPTNRQATVARIMITWPPQETNTLGQWPVNFNGSLENTIYLDLN